MQFSELNLDERIVHALEEAGIVTCTKVQDETLVHSLKGRDITAQSQTGTGKTIAFLVTAFQRSIGDAAAGARTLIVAPTRELAVQIEKEAKSLGRSLPHRIGCFYGGVGYGEQERLLRDGVDVVIGTPGRLLDYASSGRMDFRSFGIIIIDEADRLFDMGFIPDLRRIMRAALPPTERQTMLFSATLGERVKQLAWEYMNEPVSVEIEPDVVTVREVTQVLYHVAKEEKVPLLLGLLKRDAPNRTLIFTNTKHAAEVVARRLQANGYNARFIMGDLPQLKRLALIGDMKAGKIPILVATDVAARGLHIDDVDLVINFDIPEDRESYVHRIGRTARAGKSGKAVSLACERYVYGLEGIESFINMKIPTEPVSDELLAADASSGMSFGRPLRAPARGGTRGRPSDRRGGGGRGDRRPASHERGDRDRAGREPAGSGSRGQPSQGSGGRDQSGRGQPRRPTSGRPPSGERRVTRDMPVEQRMAHYRDQHERPQGSGGGRPRSGGASGEPQRRAERPAASGRPERREGERPAARPSKTAAQSRTPPAGPRAPKTQPPMPAPPPEPAARPSLLDKIRGLFRRKPGQDSGPRSQA